MNTTTNTGGGLSARPSVVNILGKIPLPIWTLAGALLVWEFLVRHNEVPDYVMPAPSRIFDEIVAFWPRLITHGAYTLSEVLIGYTCAVMIAVPLAVLVTYSTIAQKAIYPLIVATQSIPKVALAPILVAWFGYGIMPKIVIVILICFFPIVINTTVGLRSIPREMIYLAQSMGASSLQTFWRFRLPQALPNLFAGLKLATVLSVIGAVVAEFVGSDQGLGYVITVAGSTFNIARQFAAIIGISLIGVTFFAFIEFIERKAVPWKDPSKTLSEG